MARELKAWEAKHFLSLFRNNQKSLFWNLPSALHTPNYLKFDARGVYLSYFIKEPIELQMLEPNVLAKCLILCISSRSHSLGFDSIKFISLRATGSLFSLRQDQETASKCWMSNQKLLIAFILPSPHNYFCPFHCKKPPSLSIHPQIWFAQ